VKRPRMLASAMFEYGCPAENNSGRQAGRHDGRVFVPGVEPRGPVEVVPGLSPDVRLEVGLEEDLARDEDRQISGVRFDVLA